MAVFTSAESPSVLEESEFPLTFATALFSFLYHLATYEASTVFPLLCSVLVVMLISYSVGGDALVTSGIMESLLVVLEWKAYEPMNITVSRHCCGLELFK